MYESYIKRLLDLILSLAACVVLAIPMGIIALWIKKDSPGPVFFKQRRVGRGKKCFNILKFRTMRGDTPHDVPTHLLKNADSYITKSGAFLRRTSLDELPQIYNILKGDMSIVGPRPERPELAAELEKEIPEFSFRLQVKAGLTGYAQVHGRNAVPWEERFRMDVWYTQNITFRLDCRILLDTVRVVFRHDGIGSGTSETMEPFTGNRTAAVEVGAEKEESAQWAQGKD